MLSHDRTTSVIKKNDLVKQKENAPSSMLSRLGQLPNQRTQVTGNILEPAYHIPGINQAHNADKGICGLC